MENDTNEQFQKFVSRFNELVKDAPPEFFDKWADKYIGYVEYPMGWTIVFSAGVIESLPEDLKLKCEKLKQLFRDHKL